MACKAARVLFLRLKQCRMQWQMWQRLREACLSILKRPVHQLELLVCADARQGSGHSDFFCNKNPPLSNAGSAFWRDRYVRRSTNPKIVVLRAGGHDGVRHHKWCINRRVSRSARPTDVYVRFRPCVASAAGCAGLNAVRNGHAARNTYLALSTQHPLRQNANHEDAESHDDFIIGP